MIQTKTFTVRAIAPERLATIGPREPTGTATNSSPSEPRAASRCGAACVSRAPTSRSRSSRTHRSKHPRRGARSARCTSTLTSAPATTGEGELPADLRTGPRLLRTYRADRDDELRRTTLIVAEGADLEVTIRRLLDEPDVARPCAHGVAAVLPLRRHRVIRPAGRCPAPCGPAAGRCRASARRDTTPRRPSRCCPGRAR